MLVSTHLAFDRSRLGVDDSSGLADAQKNEEQKGHRDAYMIVRACQDQSTILTGDSTPDPFVVSPNHLHTMSFVRLSDSDRPTAGIHLRRSDFPHPHSLVPTGTDESIVPWHESNRRYGVFMPTKCGSVFIIFIHLPQLDEEVVRTGRYVRSESEASWLRLLTNQAASPSNRTGSP